MRIPQSLIPPFASAIRDEEPLDVESIGSEEILLEDANVQSETSPLEIVSVKDANTSGFDLAVKLRSDKHTAKQLKELCREQGLLLGGTKMDLASRLTHKSM